MFKYLTARRVAVTEADLLLVAKADSTAIKHLSPPVQTELNRLCKQAVLPSHAGAHFCLIFFFAARGFPSVLQPTAWSCSTRTAPARCASSSGMATTSCALLLRKAIARTRGLTSDLSFICRRSVCAGSRVTCTYTCVVSRPRCPLQACFGRLFVPGKARGSRRCRCGSLGGGGWRGGLGGGLGGGGRCPGYCRGGRSVRGAE
jgi:hypothetical protein